MNEPQLHSSVAEVLSPVGTGEKISMTTTNAAGSITFDGIVDLTASSDCFINIGSAAAVNTSYFMLAGMTYRFTIKGKVNAITAAGSGELQCHPVKSA